MRLLERDQFLSSLAECAGQVRAGEGRLVLVSGEAGVGKTALLEQFEQRLPDATWAWSACDGMFTPRPLGPLFDIAERWGGPLLAACTNPTPREVLFSSLMRQLAAPGRLRVVVVEDVHWADEATLDLLRFLGRRIRGVRALVLATYRDDGLAPDDPLLRVLGELGSERTTRRLALPPLSESAVGVLAGSSTIEPTELFRLTGGNPFFVTEVLNAGRATLPVSARDAVLSRVAGLPEAPRRLLDVAALAGARLDPALLEAVHPGASTDLDACLASGVLTEDGGTLRFRHEIARLAVADAVPAHRRAGLHAALLAALRASGSIDDARAAHHAEGAGDAAAVLEFAPRAGRTSSELAAHRDAAAQYERALRFAAGLLPGPAASLYDALAHELALVDRWQDSADTRVAALALWRAAGDRLREGDELRLLSRALWRLCRGAEAEAAASEALDVLESLPPGPELAWATANLAVQKMLHRDNEESIRLARRSQELAGQLGRPDVLSDALNTEGCSTGFAGRPGTGLLEQALEVALAAGLDEQAGRAYANLHALLDEERRLAEADRVFSEGVPYCDEHDVGTFGTCLRGERAVWLERTGRWDEAAGLAEQLLSRSGPSPVNRLNVLVTLGLVRARRGRRDCWVPLDEAATDADGTGEAEWIGTVRLARTEAAWLVGRDAAATQELHAAAAVSARCDPWLRGSIAAWQRRLGPPADVPDDVAEPYRRQLAGDWKKAAVTWESVGCPYEAALARLDSGVEEGLRPALRGFEALGATAAARVARRAMRRLGIRAVPVGPRPATRAHRFGLTRREQEVLELVAAGLANADISRRLFISERTVDHHVTAVLSKMGVPSRGRAAVEARRQGLVGPPLPRDGSGN